MHDSIIPGIQQAEERLREAMLAAQRKEMAVVFAGLPDGAETEGLDLRDLRLPAGEVEVIEQVCAANPNTVVVLQCGSPVEMPWRDKPRAILLMGLAGCQGGQATARLLTGAVNPCGKLAETWPVGEEDTCLWKDFPVGDEQVRYGESMFAGYRFHDLAGSRVAWPFGHGLSYTRFGYSNLQVTQGTGGFVALCRITNEGDTMGSEVVQLYTAPVSCATFRISVTSPWCVRCWKSTECASPTATNQARSVSTRAMSNRPTWRRSMRMRGPRAPRW